MSEPIISVSGLRGTIPDQLTPQVAIRYLSALAATLPAGTVVVSRDGRTSGSMISHAAISALVGHGLNALDIGIASTPTVGVQVRRQRAVAGIQISASHNPKEYNGLKLFDSDGRVLTKSKGEKVLEGYRDSRSKWSSVDQLGHALALSDPHSAHLDLVLATVDVERIRQQRFRVLLDSNHGAGSTLGRILLERLGCEMTILGGVADGNFEHSPEPVSENLSSVCSVVSAGNFQVSFCQDPDADRLAVIDERGAYIGEEMTLALCLMQVLPQLRGPIVTNCATSSLARVLAERFDIPLHLSAVGEANVVDLMLECHAVFGGEGNGGPIDPRVGLVRDSFVGMAQILNLMVTRQQTIGELVQSLPALAMVKEKIQLDAAKLPELLDCMISTFNAPQESRQDGLRLDWSDRWLLVRGSNTEPIVRLIAEAPTVDDARRLCESARHIAAAL